MFTVMAAGFMEESDRPWTGQDVQCRGVSGRACLGRG